MSTYLKIHLFRVIMLENNDSMIGFLGMFEKGSRASQKNEKKIKKDRIKLDYVYKALNTVTAKL